jgi:hypothetical protein
MSEFFQNYGFLILIAVLSVPRNALPYTVCNPGFARSATSRDADGSQA